jgi:tetratricopeptide (TPR) repeat protein
MSAVRLRGGKIGEAAPFVEDARRIDPDRAEVLEEMARIYEADKKLGAAESLLKNAREKYPRRWTTTAALGRLYGVWNKYDQAIPLLEEVVQRVPKNPKALINLANAYFSLGHDAQAIDKARQALAITPTAEAYNTLGAVLYSQGKFAEAEEQFSKASQHKPSDHALWGGLGDARRMLREPVQAAEAYRRAERLALADLEVNKNDPFALSGLALYRAQLGDARSAKEEIARALELDRSGEVLFIACLVYEAIQDRDKAIKCLDDALKADYSPIMARRYPDLSELLKDDRARALRSRLGP